jgi:hypothetical protein
MTFFTNVDWIVNIFAAEFYEACVICSHLEALWLERNKRVFRNKSNCVDQVLVYVGVGEK